MIDGVPEGEPRSFGSKLKRFFLIFGLVLLGLLIAGGIFVWYNLAKLSLNPLDFGALAQTDGHTNVLILGVGDPGHAGQTLSDTMMVVSIDHTNKHVTMISLPRDLRVPIPGHGSAKINDANAFGGPTLAEQTVANVLGIPIHYYIETDFTGLKQAVDDVGGLDITVTERLYDPEYPCPGDRGVCGVDIKPGNYHMNGDMVLQYTRCRKGTCGNDFGRAARQQEVIQKLQDKIAHPGIYLNLKTDAALLTTLRTYAKTDLSANDLVGVGLAMHRATNTTKFVFSTSPGGFLTNGGGSDLAPIGGNFSPIQHYVQTLIAQ